MTIYQIVAKGDIENADQVRNVHHYEFPGYTPNTSELQEAVDAIDAAYKTNLQSFFATTVSINAYDVRRVDVPDLPSDETPATAGGWVGGNAVSHLPNQVSALVTFKAPTVFPRSSRAYMFPFTEADNITGGIISTGLLVALADWGSAMLSLAITGQTAAAKVAVKYTLTPPRVTAWNTIDTVTVSNVWATQRRRRKGVGA
jgi:hypothetical protein